VTAFMSGDHPRQRRRHLRAQGNVSLSLILEIIELSDDLLAALGGEQFQRFKRWTIILPESVRPSGCPPLIKNVLASVGTPQIRLRKRLRVKITEAGKAIHT